MAAKPPANATPPAVGGTLPSNDPGISATALAVVVIVKLDDAAAVPRLRLAGAKLQLAPAGKPLQDKDTSPEKLAVGVSVTTTLTA